MQLSLGGNGVQCIAVDPADHDTVYAGLADGGVRRSSDGCKTWVDCGLPAPQVFSVAVSAADGAVYAGTEPSALYRSDDRGKSWRGLDGLLELPSRPTWSFPPRPWTSHVRWIAPSPHDADVVLAGIELGGLMRSTDGGETWEDQRPGSQPDVHSLAWHPQVEESRVRSRRWRRGVERGRRRHLARCRRGPRSPLHVVGGSGSCRSRPVVRVGQHRPVRSARHARRPAGAHLSAKGRRLGSARGRSPGSSACDAVRARRDREPDLRRASRTASFGRAPTAGTAGARCELDEPLPRLVALAYAS